MTEIASNPPVATPDYAMLFKRSLAAIDELEARLATTQRQQREPIAIVGMACRFPGNANTPQAFWKLLQDGVDAVTEVPPERWDANLYFDPDPNAVGKTYSRWGAFVGSVDRFDAAFFGISPREAISLDPQQRLLLEVTWEALENAGIAPSSLAGSATAVYVGITTHDYAMRMAESVGFRNGDAYTSSGTAHSVAAGRLSYFLGVHGPNAAVDTACSSSLVALHWAIQSLRRGEANMALAGGVNLTLIPDGSILTSRARMISSDGRCKTFDASADGYVRGEGCGVLALKRLSDAQRDGDTVLAVIRGSALNQDGRSSGLSAPNGLAQESVIRAALADAGLAADDIDYVEAHGTGTPLGDPIEIKALGEVFGQRPAGRVLRVGSVKTNIGHLEAAAGIAGVIKTVLALQHRTIPPHLHLSQPNPLIDWARYCIEVPLQATAWQAHADAPCRAGISSFGFSGTNSHVVLEEAPVTPAPVIAASTTAPRSELLVISAQSQAALTELASRYCGTIAAGTTAPSSDGSPNLAAVAVSAALGRSHFAERLAIVAASADEAYRQLAAFAASGYPSDTAIYGRSTGSPPETVFMFTGQGAQYVGMARQLFETEPVFRATLEECERLLAPLLSRPLLSVILAESESDTLINDTAFTQPALFAVEYALTQLWRSWGIEPTVVLGHSVGEFVAACVAGVFSLEDGLRMIAARGGLMSALPRNGAMAAVFATEAQVDQVLSGYQQTVSVAATNGPQSIVISGVATDIAAILARLADEGIDSQPLAVSHAFHSPLMEPILDAFEDIVAKVRLSPPRIGVISNLTGGLVFDEMCDPHYWRRHVREPVRFAGSIATALGEGYKLFLEVGPNATLLQMARRCDGGAEAVWLGSLRKGHGDRDQLLRTLGQLYVRGARPNWRGVVGAEAALRRATLPTYPFQRERYWLDYKPAVAQSAVLGATRTGHSLLGGVVASPVRIFEQKLGVASRSWLADYRIHNRTLFPSGGLIEIAMAAAQEVFGVDSVSGCVLRNVVMGDALRLPAEGDVVLQVIVKPAQDREQTIELFHRIDSPTGILADDYPGWQLHLSCNALRSEAPASAIGQTDRRRDGLAGNANGVEVSQYYEELAVRGAEYGPAFRAIEHIMRGEREAWGRIRVPAAVTDSERLILHPALLEAVFQLACTVPPPSDELYMPIALGGYRVLREGVDTASVHVNFDPASFEAGVFRADVTLFDLSGHSIAELSGLQLRRFSRAAVADAHGGSVHADWMYEMAWPAAARLPSTRSEAGGRWLVVCDSSGIGDRLADRMVKEGAQVERVRRNSDPRTDGYRIDFADAAQWREVLAKARTDGDVQGIVALNVIDASSRLLEDQTCAADHIEPVAETLALAQAIGDSGPRVWFVSRGSQAVAGSVPEPVQAAAWGLAGVMASEAPALRVVRLDLDPAARPDDDSLLFEAVWTPDDEDRVALRDGRRHVARLVPAPRAGITIGASKISSNASYLITGGLGGLGLACGRWLASEGARRLVLLGRQSPSVAAQARIAELRRDGVEVLIVQADVADGAQLAAGLAGAASATMPLRGILHAAGVVNDALLSELDPERLDRVWAPKVRGTLNLLRSCQPASLDFLVMFSAGAALFGSPGQGNYAAANSFMDALAHVLRSQGRHAVSINWGSWSGTGMAAAVSVLHRRRWAALGMEMIEPEDGVLALRDVLRADSLAQVAVLPIVRKRLPDGSSPLLRSLIGSATAPVQASRKQTIAASSGRILALLASAPKASRSNLLADFLADQVASVLALGESRSVDHYRSLMELGLDSLMAMELRNRIYSTTGASIAVADLLLGPSIVQLSNQLLDELSFDHDSAGKLVAASEEELAWDGGTL